MVIWQKIDDTGVVCTDGKGVGNIFGFSADFMTFALAAGRPLPPLVAPVLQGQLQEVLARLCAAFPPAKACLEAASEGGGALPGGISASRPRPAALALVRDEFDDEDDDDEGARPPCLAT